MIESIIWHWISVVAAPMMKHQYSISVKPADRDIEASMKVDAKETVVGRRLIAKW